MSKDKDSRKQRNKPKAGVVFPLADSLQNMPKSYQAFIIELKKQIKSERLRTIISANQSMIILYWRIGKSILEQQKKQGWGAKVIDRMSFDLKEEFPSLTGFSPRNLKYMRKFAEAWPNFEIVQRTVALIPWRSNITLLDKLKDSDLRLWYANKTIENGFGKDMLVFQIESKLHIREGRTINNFEQALIPPLESDMANQAFKDPYIFNFVGNDEHIREKELENSLIENIQKFLLELGQGFAFVGRQVHLELGSKDFYLDFKQFFEYYKVINAKHLASRIGMNETLLSQYVNGKKKPSKRQIERIVEGLNRIGQELMELSLV